MAIKKDAAKREAGKVSAITASDLKGVTTWMFACAADLLKHKHGEKPMNNSMLGELILFCQALKDC